MKMLTKDRLRHSIIKTLVYADVFDFPLKANEAWKYYIGSKKVTRQRVFDLLESMVREELIDRKSNYYFLLGRQRLVKIRESREKESISKINIAHKVAKILKLIPTVKLIGISGSLSMRNAKKTDDIDLFIITGKDSLWITRFLVNIALILIGYKRGRDDSFGMNLICPNMFLAKDRLSIPKEKQNIFCAHEVAQLSVLVDKEDTYKLFLCSNSWIIKFLPNVIIPERKNIDYPHSNLILSLTNRLFYVAQFLYMRSRITDEEIKINVAKFHPRDKSEFITGVFVSRYRSYIAHLDHKIKDAFLEKSASAAVTPGY